MAVLAGLAAGSVSLVGFGADSLVEVSAALVLAWRLRKERDGGCMQTFDRRATRAVAVTLVGLALYIAAQAVVDLATGARPGASTAGIVLAGASLVVMPLLARAKRRLAPALGSQAVQAEAAQTSLCAWLSGILLVGLGANALAGWWWADPVAALGIAALAAVTGRRYWRPQELADTCCG